MVKRFLKNSKGIIITIFPIAVTSIIALAYLALKPIYGVMQGQNSISMEYENQVTIYTEQKNPDDDIPIVKYKGYDTYGELRIPSISVTQKVISSVTADAIEVSCAYLYSTNGFNQIGNTVIIGHNYKNGELFSNVTKLSVGDKMYLKTNGEEEIAYTIYQTFETTSTDASFYNRDTDGKREITLSTCTDDVETTDNRLIILAREN